MSNEKVCFEICIHIHAHHKCTNVDGVNRFRPLAMPRWCIWCASWTKSDRKIGYRIKILTPSQYASKINSSGGRWDCVISGSAFEWRTLRWKIYGPIKAPLYWPAPSSESSWKWPRSSIRRRLHFVSGVGSVHRWMVAGFAIVEKKTLAVRWIGSARKTRTFNCGVAVRNAFAPPPPPVVCGYRIRVQTHLP